MNENEQIHASSESAQFAFFTQKLTQLETLIQQVLSSNQELITKVSVMHSQMQHNDEKTKRLFEVTDEHGKKLQHHSNTLNIHAFIWKTIGTGAIASFGILGWGYATLQGLYKSDNETDRRLTILEFVVNREPNVKLQTNKGKSNE